MTERGHSRGGDPGEQMIGAAAIREIEQFLYREARLLDERRFAEWLDLFTDDVRYTMSTRGNYYPSSSKAVAALDPARRPNDDRDDEDALAVLDETKATLAGRVARLGTGMAWAEDPPSRTRHMIANLEIASPRPGRATSRQRSRSAAISSSTRAARTPSRIFTSAPAATGCAGSMAPGRSPAAGSPSTRTCCSPKTSASFFSAGSDQIRRAGGDASVRERFASAG